MNPKNSVFIARSLDGYIADKDGGLDWLQTVPNPDLTDMGYQRFMDNVDALVMGRKTFETVCNFDCEWPYAVPVFVLSRTLDAIPDAYVGKAELVNGTPREIVEHINAKGFHSLYIDGGTTIQSFLRENLIDEFILTTIPILLGGGSPLFGEMPNQLKLEHIDTEVFLGNVVQSTYRLAE